MITPDQEEDWLLSTVFRAVLLQPIVRSELSITHSRPGAHCLEMPRVVGNGDAAVFIQSSNLVSWSSILLRCWTGKRGARGLSSMILTLEVPTRLHRQANHTILSAQREDGLRDKAFEAGYVSHLRKIIGCRDYTHVCIVDC